MSASSGNHWPGFTDEEALIWGRVLLLHSPHPQNATIKNFINNTLKAGRIVSSESWVKVATAARSCGFTPDLYLTVFDALQSIDADVHPAHPAHRRHTHPNHVPGVPFEPELWADVPRLVIEEGYSPAASAELALYFADSRYAER
ncbi:MAG: hypothetical protein L0H43_07995 [Brevibacterium aurantiacum]|nr:hypothetical protein [Brevibacterium aurantiacum]